MKYTLHIRHLIAFLVITLLVLKAQAQTQTPVWDTLPWKQYADYKLQYLDKNQITTNVLYDRVFPIANVDEYTGLPAETNTDTTTPQHFTQAYYEMYNSTYNNQSLVSPEGLNSMIDTSQYAVHPIGIMLYKFNSLDTNALQDHLIDTLANGQFTDVPNRPRSPYFTNTSFLASPLLAEDEVIEQGDQSFSIDPAFFINNQNLNITQVKIDFGDGQGYWVVNNPNTSGTFGLTGGGAWGFITKNIVGNIVGRIIVVAIDLLGNTIQYGNPFKIMVANTKPYSPLTTCKGLTQWVIETPQPRLDGINNQYGNPQLDYRKTIVQDCFPGVPGLKCKVKVPVKDTAYFYFSGNGSSCGSTIKKPVIFIDGFDPTNSRGVQQIYENYINKNVDRPGYTGGALFGDYMLNKGYDFIILDFKHGNDLLERNALTLVSLIERLNATYASGYEQDITVIGPSMGSLIAQYALAYMEKNNIQHHVKTYISFDGCHQGANVPIGLQNYIEYFTKRGIFKKKDLIRNGLYNGLAARQMLAHHVSANSQSVAPDALRTMFLQNLTAVGEYPKLCRKVAIINGASSGIINEDHTTVSQSLLRIYTQRKGWKSVWGNCNDKICMKLDWECFTTPNTGSEKVMQMWTVEPVFNILFWVPLGMKNTYANAAWNNSAQDNAPGGKFGHLFGSLPGDIIESKFKFLLKDFMYLLTGSKRTSFTQNINEFTMMPSYSAADLRFPTMTDNSNKNLYMKWDDQYLCGHTPFDYVYAPTSSNEEHVSITGPSSLWFENEIACPVSDLPVFMTPKITGDATMCSTSSIYSIATCQPTSLNVNWTVSPQGIVSINGSGTQISLTKIQNGVVTLSASNNASCGNNFNFSKQIVIGPSTPNIVAHQTSATGEPTTVQFTTDLYLNTTYNWYVNNSLVQSGSGNTLDYYFPCRITKTITCKLVNSCGTSNASNAISITGSCLRSSSYTVSPNPASNTVSVSGIQSNSPNSPQNSNGKINEIRIFDLHGNLKKIHSYPNVNNVVINISDFINGTYFIEITNGSYKEKQQLIIQK